MQLTRFIKLQKPKTTTSVRETGENNGNRKDDFGY